MAGPGDLIMSFALPSSRMARTLFSVWILSMFLYSIYFMTASGARPLQLPHVQQQQQPSVWQRRAAAIIRDTWNVTASPVQAPYKDKFALVGRRTRTARKWVEFLDSAPAAEDKRDVQQAVEGAIASVFPFLKNSPKHPGSKTPFSDLRNSLVPGSRGVVIPTGKETVRFAAHLIGALREVLHTDLDIQVVYAGDGDFPPDDRARLASRFKGLQFLDIMSVMDDTTAKLERGGWAIKAFAALYSPFEQVILLDADCVFTQKPELLLADPAYVDTGALLFHDRLLWQHYFRERHDWWKAQIWDPSPALDKSLVWTEDYAEEGDSGAVVLDKSRLDVLMGLLHVVWQNTKAVRDEVTYTMTYGDKESWWFGLELGGSRYAFEKHYGSMAGWLQERKPDDKEERVCSFTIGHVDQADELFWYNGGLLKNKKTDLREFGLPTHLMVDGRWEKGASKNDMSCMAGKEPRALNAEFTAVLSDSIALAEKLDAEFEFLKDDGD